MVETQQSRENQKYHNIQIKEEQSIQGVHSQGTEPGEFQFRVTECHKSLQFQNSGSDESHQLPEIHPLQVTDADEGQCQVNLKSQTTEFQENQKALEDEFNTVRQFPETRQFHTVRGYLLLEQNKKLLTSGMEDYLEMIYRNSLAEGYIRINTLSELLNVQAPSATNMVQKLSKLGLVIYKKYGFIYLTGNGIEIGKYLLHRHNIIETFLKNLGVIENLLIETELIEHFVSGNTVEKLELLNRYLEENPDISRKFASLMT